ncbi:uncharacterized protein LOC121741234 [Salvia splendens]|uniref:uncharacterized protein LOC121741234 n=1 Tax=Salvia splendens TaxID=180675 RepID=UPI001C27C784|nr:uncharacterized protein LOC121741234 [Salvia splendens]
MAAPLSPLSLSLVYKLRPLYLFTAHEPFSPLRSPSLSLPHSPRWCNLNPPDAFTPTTTKRWKISAANYDFLLAEASPAESSQAIVSTSDDGVSTIISVLLLIAFIGLTIFIVGVIYIAVTDFMQKREGEKYKNEEAERKKKGGKKGKVRARARDGPRGFGQKIQQDDDDDFDLD